MSTTLDVSLKALYVQGSVPDVDASTVEQLRTIAPELQITTIAGSPAALVELRRTPGWHALLASPSLPQNEILALITSLRRDRIPIAIVPIVDEAHQDVFASAVAAGADDVLMRREGSLVSVTETLARIRQSPHLFPAEQRRRIAVLYAGNDPLVWNLLDQVPFVKAERVACGVDGTCPVRRPGADDGSLRADAVIIDEHPGQAHPLQVLKSVKAQASDLPVIMLTSAGAADIATAALELGADDTVLKTGIFRRRLIATLRRVHQRIELTAQQVETKVREDRLRQIVENVPTAIIVVTGGGQVLAMNAAALQLFGAGRPRDVVGRDFRHLVGAQDRELITDIIHKVTKGEAASAAFEALTIEGARIPAYIQAVVLERDARGNRGVVASIMRADLRLVGVDDHADELASLRDALQRMERHYAELEEARASEQAAWESERHRLEARLEEAERLASERTTLETRLTDVTGELTRTSESFASERQALEVRLQELEAAVREATSVGDARFELERALEAVREEQQQAVAAHTLERSGWEAIRAELEARVRELDGVHETAHASTVASLQEDVRRLEQTLADERGRWNATREQLEAELQSARETLWAEHNQRETARAQADAELARLREEAAQAQSAWDQARTALEQEAADARNAADTARRERDDTRTHFEQELQHLRSALEQETADARSVADTARRERDDTRAHLEQELQHLRAALDRERAEWHEQRSLLEGEQHRVHEIESDRQELTSALGRLEAELEDVRRQLAQERASTEDLQAKAAGDVERAQESARAIADEYDATRTRLERERDDARQALAAERDAWNQRRLRFEEALAGASNQAQIIQQRWEADRHERSAEHDRMLAAERATWQARIAALEAELQQAVDTAHHRDEEWAGERQRLEALGDDARRVLTDERQQWDARQAQDHQTIEQLRQERDEAHRRVGALEAQLDETRRLAGDRDTLAVALDAARNELRHTDDAHHAERERWDQARQAFEQHLRDREAAHESERSAWNRARTQLEGDARRSALVERERQQLDEALTALRAEYEALTRTLEDERTHRDHDRREIDTLRTVLADAEARQADHEAALERASHSAGEQLARQIALHENRVRQLEAEMRESARHFEQAIEEAERAHAALNHDYDRASESHERLIASGAFGYAVTTLSGELVRCNDAFARLFGFDDAADAVMRTAGRLFPALSNRPEIEARLSTNGRVERVTSCVERIDGRAIRIVETAAVLGDDNSDAETLVEHVIVEGAAAPTAEEIQGRRVQEVGALTTAMMPEIESLITTVHERSADVIRRSSDRPVTPADLEHLRNLIGEASALVHQLAAFSRRQVRGSEPIDLGRAAASAEPVLARLVGDYISFSTDLGASTPITAQPDDLDQLLTSLVTHGRDLLPAGGSIVVGVRQQKTGAPVEEGSFGEPGPILSVSASGYGVQFPNALPVLELVAQRCGGRLRVTGEAGWTVRLQVHFPRCGLPSRPGWDWLAE